jgi:AraC-like DNA-binding protein
MELSEDLLSPRVLSAYGFQGQSILAPLRPRITADFEFEFLTEGGGSQWIAGVSYPLAAGDVVWRRPGMKTQGVLPYSCLTVILDLAGDLRPGRDPYSLQTPKAPQPDFQTSALGGLEPVFTPQEPEEYRRLFAGMVRSFVNPGPGAALALRALSLELLARLAAEPRTPELRTALPPETSVRLRRVTRFLSENFSRRLVLDDLAREAGLSPTYLHGLFTGALGLTPREYLTRLRLARARELLVATSLPAADVARECGFENVPYFFTLFRKQTGLPPGAFRRRNSPLEL